ncbi:MAG: GNAT family N-acetyltransferase [Paracoccaceae bacterium]
MIRPATPHNGAAMAAILNQIIAIGGTTAHQIPLTGEMISCRYIEGVDSLTCVVAEASGQVVGWQSVGWDDGEAHIGTFVDPGAQAKGIGSALFAQTRALCAAKGITEIFATIRADNTHGLAYYVRLGFTDIGSEPGYALRNGEIVGRIHRKLSLR